MAKMKLHPPGAKCPKGNTTNGEKAQTLEACSLKANTNMVRRTGFVPSSQHLQEQTFKTSLPKSVPTGTDVRASLPKPAAHRDRRSSLAPSQPHRDRHSRFTLKANAHKDRRSKASLPQANTNRDRRQDLLPKPTPTRTDVPSPRSPSQPPQGQTFKPRPPNQHQQGTDVQSPSS
jgi:hypothetical protein